MSRRKDRERFTALRGQNPGYRGFRGYQDDAASQGDPLQAVTCTVCGRRRNVSQDVAQEQSEGFVCLSCREERDAGEPQADEPQGGDVAPSE